MKCLSAVALFCLIAIVSAGIADSVIPNTLHRLRRDTQNFQSSSSSSSSQSAQGGDGQVHFVQQSTSFIGGAPVQTQGNIPTFGLADRFGPDDGTTGTGQTVGGGVGHITSVAGTYDPNSQQTTLHQNFHQQFQAPFYNNFPNNNFPNNNFQNTNI